MLTFIKQNLIPIILILTVIGLIVYMLFLEAAHDNRVDQLKTTILANDKLIKVKDGQYTKLVNDQKTLKELKEEVKGISKDVYNEIRNNKETIVNNTGVSVRPVTKTIVDTVFIDSTGTRRFTSYYPNKDSAFVTHRSTIVGNLATNTWDFKPLKINVIVTEQKDGMYRARLIGPTWLEADEVTVNSLPMNSITERKFKYLLGGSGGYDFNSRGISVGVYTGVRYKGNIVLINGATNKVVSIGYIKEF